MRFIILTILHICTTLVAISQFQDDFSNGNFTEDPTWVGDTENFSVEDNQLRLTAPAVASTSYLSTESQAIENATWEFWLRMTFQPSGSNFARVYIVADQSNLTGSINGYFVKIGDTQREISLYRQSGNTTTKVIDGVDGRVASNNVEVRIRVTRDETGNWTLASDTLGGNDYFQEGQAFDDTHVQGFYTGVFCRYTATRSDRFYFDDFNVTGDPFFDPDPPVLLEALATSNNEIEIQFDKVVTEGSASIASNFNLNMGIGEPSIAFRNLLDATKINLVFDDSFEIGTIYTLSTENIEDLSGNISEVQTTTIQYIEAQEAEFGDLIINEFLPRESPSVGLPEGQYVELYNRSNKYIQVNGWKLSDRTGTGTVQNGWIYPGEYLLLVPTSGLADYPEATNVTNWQSLNNTGDDIVLETNTGVIIDKISYTDNWYQDDNKKSGGWSIERINPFLACSGEENWKASEHENGGTPNQENSIFNDFPDTTLPELVNASFLSPNELLFEWSKGMDSTELMEAVFDITPFNELSERLIEGVFPNSMILVFEDDFIPNTIYSFSWGLIADCSGNINTFEGEIVLPDTPEKGDIVINEILHHVLVGGSDFVELYNNSEKFIDLKDWQLGNHTNDTVGNLRVIDYSYILAPKDYVAITRDSSFQLINYPFAVSGKFIQIPALPSYTNDSSTVYLVYEDEIMDKVSYTSDWHFRLLQSRRGVSLERFDVNSPSNDGNNWHSASETVGFATPGRENSQVRKISAEGTLSISSASFSPDNDGVDDVLLISYELTDPEMQGSLVIYDDLGRKTTTLLNNHLLGTSGTIKWDGVRDDGAKASIGPYIILFDALNVSNGERIIKRKVVTVAGQL